MSYFKQLDFPSFDSLTPTLLQLVEDGTIDWGMHKQICINTVPGYEDDYGLGTGSLMLNWDDRTVTSSRDGRSELVVMPKRDPLNPTDFKILCRQFNGTVVEEVFELLAHHYVLGRIRFMKSEPKTCLTWHTDLTPRLHYPMITQPGCFMVVEDEVRHMPANTWWEVNTVRSHTAFNGSMKSRIHLVAEVIERK